MESLCTFKACVHPAPINSRRLSSTNNFQSRRCVHFSERANILRAGSIGQSWFSELEDKSRRSMSQVMKASEAEAPVQNETVQEEIKETVEVVSQTEEKAAETVAEARKDTEEGGPTGKYWVLRSAGEGEAKSQEIVPGDGLLVGAAPNATGTAKPFVIDIPVVSSSHARVYGKERKTYKDSVHEYFVMDLGSTNGTYLNRSKLRPHTEP